MNDSSMADRLQRIETTLAHLERHYEELNEVVIEQGRLIKRLQAQQQRLADSLESAELSRIKATDPKPPHYQ